MLANNMIEIHMLKVHIPEDICFESNDKNNSICIFKDSLNHVKNITKMVASFLNINMTLNLNLN